VSTPDPAELVALAERAARAAGDLVRATSAGRVDVAATKTSPTDVVTATDRASEQLLRELLGAARPDDALLGEEAGWEPGRSGLTWVVDPIDGTVNYTYGIPAYSVSVAVVSGRPDVPGEWEPVAGCVHDVPSGETWTAARGLGARLDGRPVTARPAPALSDALLATGFGYRAERRRAQARVVAGLLPRVRDIRRVGCSSLDLCGVASGRYDGYYERGLHVWDFAAALLVATESGVVVRGPGGGPPSEDLLVAARPPLADVLAAELAAAGADRDD
jgi:myo-inositol-1(or 4)-monophosphatase